MDISSAINLKRINLQKVYKYLYDIHSSSKLDISRGTGLSIPTIASNIVELERRNLVKDGQEFKSTGGRRAQSYSICTDARIAIGVEILKEEIKVVAVNLYGMLLAETRTEAEFVNEESYFSRLASFVNDFIRNLGRSKDIILGIGIALQGLVSEDGETVVYSEILKADGLKLETFRKLFDFECRMFHDTETAALAEMWNNPDIQNAVYIALNRYFGGTLILNGKVRRTQKLASATIEHMRINQDGPLCYCGKRGCAETYCSVKNFRKRCGMDIPEFFERLHSGDRKCIDVWEAYARDLAIVINNVNMVINCNVMIGGYLLQYMNDDDVECIRRAVRAEGFAYGGEFRIVRSGLGDLAPAMGAAIDFIEQFINNI